MHQLKIFSGNSHPQLAKSIAKHLDVVCGATTLNNFSDGEIQLTLNESARGCDIFIVQPTSYSETASVNDVIMELLIMIDALKRADANKINVVIPYFGYARQDRKNGVRSPITAKLIADILQTAGAQRVLTMDLHSDQTQGFFNIPVDNLNATKLIADYFIENIDLENAVVVSPDMGGGKRARRLSELLNVGPIALIDKRRPKPNVSEIMNIVGDVNGKTVIIIDDMIDTAGTITNAAYALKEHGAKDIYICATHPVLSGNAVDKLQNCPAKEVILCDTLHIPQDKHFDKLKVLSTSKLLANAIERIFHKMSLKSLIEY